MKNVRKGDIVARKSHNKDVIFVVDRIIKNQIAILTGITTRLKADSYIDDLEKIDKTYIKNKMKYFEERIDRKAMEIKKYRNDIENKRVAEKILTGKILHLDGDSCLDNKNSH